ncbi:hypothetical protein Tco_0742488 [Tanacetum coccineum]
MEVLATDFFWNPRDKANARAMIQAIDKRLKTRRIMKELEELCVDDNMGRDLRAFYKDLLINIQLKSDMKSLLKLTLYDQRLFKEGGGDHNLWDVIVNGDQKKSSAPTIEKHLPFLAPKTGKHCTNKVITASGDFGVSIAGGINQVPSTPCAHDVAYSFLAQPTIQFSLENEDFQQDGWR